MSDIKPSANATTAAETVGDVKEKEIKKKLAAHAKMRAAICEREYHTYNSERATLVKVELAAEARYEKAMVALSTLALGFTLVFVKDWIGRDQARYTWLLGISWIAFGACLILALYNHKLTYETHRYWREKILDDEFATNKWEPGAMERAFARYDNIPNIKCVDYLKSCCFWTLVVGLVILSMFIGINYTTGRNNDKAADPHAGTADKTIPTAAVTQVTRVIPLQPQVTPSQRNEPL